MQQPMMDPGADPGAGIILGSHRLPVANPQHIKAAQAYRREQLLNMSPVEVIRKLYEVGIQACRKSDGDLANRTVTELIAGLNFDYPDISVGLFRLYRYTKDCIRQGKYDEAAGVLDELRATWVEAFHLQ